eukprot:COSAG06_NODE_27495_length_592_cov_0.827586_1_plen_99_part_10
MRKAQRNGDDDRGLQNDKTQWCRARLGRATVRETPFLKAILMQTTIARDKQTGKAEKRRILCRGPVVDGELLTAAPPELVRQGERKLLLFLLFGYFLCH